jgi:hypothetical protein
MNDFISTVNQQFHYDELVYYLPIQKDGKNMYEVVNVEKVENSKS